VFYHVNTPQTTPDAPLLFANPISCSILDNEYTIIFDTFARIRVGIDRIQCKNTVITHVFYKTDHPEHTKTHVFYKTDRQEIGQDSPGEPREPRQPREPSSAQESPESPNCMVFLKCSESL